MLLFLSLLEASAAPPVDLDGLVALAVDREPAALALALDAQAAQARTRGAARLMDPVIMVGVEALGAPIDGPDPTMGMVGVTQMFRGIGEGRALSARAALDADRALLEQDVLDADLRMRLWQAAARIRASDQELALLDEQIRSAEAARAIGFARYGAGAAVSAPMGGAAMDGGMDAMPSMGAPPVAAGRATGSGGMPGMGGGGASRPGVTVPSMPVPVPAGGPTASGGGGGIPALLRLDAEIARVAADRAALAADLAGERAVLAAFVGQEASDAVFAEPDRYLGGAAGPVPERALGEMDEIAREAVLAEGMSPEAFAVCQLVRHSTEQFITFTSEISTEARGYVGEHSEVWVETANGTVRLVEASIGIQLAPPAHVVVQGWPPHGPA